MKTKYKKIFGAFSLAAVTLFLVVSCKDEVLVPVRDTTSSDSLASLIDVLDEQKITLDTKINKITITNAILRDSSDALNNSFGDAEVEYTVNVLNAGNTITGDDSYNGGGNDRVKGVDGVTVTVLQGGVPKVVTSADGRAIFTGLKQGFATLTLSAANYVSVNATVYLGSNNNYDGAIRQVATNILMFPIGGANGLTISGNLYINRNVLNDTLGRKFSNGADAVKQNTFISNPSKWDQYNLNGQGYDDLYNLYDASVTNNYNPIVSFEALTSASGIYAYPELSNSYNPSSFDSDGYITSISYVGLISAATVDANGAYTIKVPYIYNQTASDNYGYYVYAQPITDNLTRFDDQASSTGTSQGTPGSVKKTYTLFNPSNYTKSTTDRWVLTDSWTFRSAITAGGGYSSGDRYINAGATSPGGTIISNIYYFPYSKN